MSIPLAAVTRSELLIQNIFEHAARISREQDLETMIRLNADFARDIAGADRCSLWLIDETTGELWTKVAHGLPPTRIPFGEGLVGACISQNETLLVNDTRKEIRFLRRIDLSSGYHTEQVLCVPLRMEGQVIGAFQLLNKSSGFTTIDADLLGLLGQFAASAITTERLRQQREDARLLQQQLDLAREVQSRLLPSSDVPVSGLDVAAFCRPAEVVGGDYFDLLPFNDGGFAFTLGDVAGKGVPAALMMASIQTLLRTLLQRCGRDMASLIGELNRTLYASSSAERYSTLFSGYCSPDRSQLTYVNAGHVPPLLCHSNRQVEQLTEANLPVGILPFSQYSQHTVTFNPGDLLLVVSDGITEAADPTGEFWELARVERVLAERLSEIPVGEIPAALTRHIDLWTSGVRQQDDITVVAVRRTS